MKSGSAHAIAAVLLAYSIAAAGATAQPVGKDEAGPDGARPPTQQLDIAPLVSLLQSQPVLPAVPKSDQVLAPRLQPRESAKLTANLAAMPLSFEANRGQTADEVEYIARGPGYTVFLTPTEAVFALRQAGKPEDSARPGKRGLDALSRLAKPEVPMPVDERHASDEPAAKGAVIRMKLQGASARPVVEGLESLPGTVNYFSGNDPAKWHSGIPTYRKVQYKDIYPGIDLVYYGNPRQLEHDFVVAPGADPGRIRIAFEGLEGQADAPALRLTDEGNLVLSVAGGELLVRKPHVYQEVAGRQVKVAADFVLHRQDKDVGVASAGATSIGFRLAAYDSGRPLVIDPVVVYSTYAGGLWDDKGIHIAVDVGGNPYVTGYTGSLNFPTVRPKYPNRSGTWDVFVFKLSSDGGAILYSTYLGGTGGRTSGQTEDDGFRYNEDSFGIAVDASGSAYVTGETYSNDFPITRAIYPNYSGNGDAFVFKLSSDGQTVHYSTYFGGSQMDRAKSIALDAAGNAYVTGFTASNDFPTERAKYPTKGVFPDAFVFKLSSDGQTVHYSTYLGGKQNDTGTGIAVDAGGNAYVTGETESDDFPMMRAIYPNYSGQGDAFVFKLSSDGQTVHYSTYLGGKQSDYGIGIAVDAGGNAYVTGGTESDDFPTMRAIYPNYSDQGDAFVFKLSSDGQTVHFATYVGGSRLDRPKGIALDVGANAYVTGATLSSDFPTVRANYAELWGVSDAFVFKLSSNGDAMRYSTYLGGRDFGEDGTGIAVDASGNAYVTGYTNSPDFPTVRAIYPNFLGTMDAFIIKISDSGGGVFADSNQTGGLKGVLDTPNPSTGQLLPDVPPIAAGDIRQRNVVVLVHGWNSDPAAWATDTKSIIKDRLSSQNKLCDSPNADPCWAVSTWNWAYFAGPFPPIMPIAAWFAGWDNGAALAQALARTYGPKLNHLHLVGHSAGSNLIQSAASWFQESKRTGGIAPRSLHLTFLDPYTPLTVGGVLSYGKVDSNLISSFSDSYVTDDPPPQQLADELLGPIGSVDEMAGRIAYMETRQLLEHAYNFRVSGLDTDASAVLAKDWAIQNHQWPYQLYQCSANPRVGSFRGEVGEPCPAGYAGTYAFGFPLSQESGYASSLQTLRRNYKRGGGCLAISIDLCLDFGEATKQVVTELVQDIVDSSVTVASATGRAVVWIGNQAYEVGTAAFQALGNFSLSQVQRLTFFSGSPVWVRLPITITEPANSLRFDFNFTQGTRGYLQAFIHGKQIYSADQQFYAANTVWHSPEIGVGELEPGTYEIAFRLDPLADTQSVVELTNLSLGMMRAVAATNQGPIANAGANRAVRLGSLVTLDGGASLDPDDGPMALTYNWLQTGGSSASLSDPANAQPAFTPASFGTYAFSLTVSDGDATSPAATVVVTVPRLGDIDGDGDVDNDDLNLVLAARNRPASGPNDLRDLDGNSRIDALDARKLTTLCNRPRCALQ